MLYWVTIGFSRLLTLRVNINVSPFMCIWAGTYIFPDASQTRSQLHRLLDMYDSVCRPSSTSFIPSASEDIVVANLFGHGLVIGTTCQDHPRRRTRIMEHLLAGLSLCRREWLVLLGRRASMSERVRISPCLLRCLRSIIRHHWENRCTTHGLLHSFIRCWYSA